MAKPVKESYPTLEEAIQDTKSISPEISFLGAIGKITQRDGHKVELEVYDEPKSAATEGFRFVRTNFRFLHPDKQKKSVLITSAMPTEGCTTVASNLAITLANLGNKVLLVDGNMRVPGLHKIFDCNREGGLSELLSSDVDLSNMPSETIRKTEIENLSLIVSGAWPSRSPADLFDSDRFKELVPLLTEQYDYVIFDSPPNRAVTDSMILSILVDYIIYVFDIANVPKDVVKGGLKSLTELNPTKPIGVLCNIK